MSPVASGICAVPGDLVAVQRRHHVPVERQPGGGRRAGHGGRADRLRAAVPVGQGAEPLDRHLRRRAGPGRLVVARLVDVDHRVEVGIERGQHRVGAQRGLVQPGDRALARTGTRGAAGAPPPASRRPGPARCGRRRPAAAGSRGRPAGPRPLPRSAARSTRRTNAGCRNGMSVEQTNAISARPATRGQPGGQPLHRAPGPRAGPSTTSASGGSSGSACPGARTTTTGPSVARGRMPTVRRSSVEPCHSRAALGVPIRDDRPPASTIPAVPDMLRSYVP